MKSRVIQSDERASTSADRTSSQGTGGPPRALPRRRILPASVRRRSWLAGCLLALALILLIVGVVGCSSGQRRDPLGEVDARDVLRGKVENVLAAQHVELTDGLTCRSDIAESALTATCEGTTTAGESVTGRFVGTADVDRTECVATLTVLVDNEPIADEPSVDCFG